MTVPNDRRAFLRRSAYLAGGLTLAGCSTRAMQEMAGTLPDPTQPVSLGDPNARSGQYVSVNGARIFHSVTGSGTPMLLLHGYPLSGALFSRVRDALSQRYRVITVDHRGYGNSEAPGVPDDVALHARDALAVMDQLDVPTAIVGGMSMGGPITFSMYQMAPERFRGMMLIDTIAAPAGPPEAGLWRGVAELVRMKGVDALPPVLIKDMLSGDTRVKQPEVVSYLEQVIKAASTDAAIGGAQALATRPDFQPLLSQIRVPTLVYVGVEDTLYPVAIAKAMADAIPSATLEMIPGAAHAAIFEAPEPSSQAILRWADGIA